MYMHTHIHTYMHTYIHTHKHPYTHTYMHIYTYTLTNRMMKHTTTDMGSHRTLARTFCSQRPATHLTWYIAGCCRVLQGVAGWCRVLRCYSVLMCSFRVVSSFGVLQCVAVCAHHLLQPTNSFHLVSNLSSRMCACMHACMYASLYPSYIRSLIFSFCCCLPLTLSCFVDGALSLCRAGISVTGK